RKRRARSRTSARRKCGPIRACNTANSCSALTSGLSSLSLSVSSRSAVVICFTPLKQFTIFPLVSVAVVLSGVCLIKADLRGAVLIGALMLGANLTKADLRKANLSGAYLGKIADYGVISLECDSSANLNEADLRKAILEKTDLTEACLM